MEWRFIPEHEKERIGLTFDHDGEFWMSFQDWMRYFDRVEICNLCPTALSDEQISGNKKRWEMSVFEGEWVQGSSAGGCRNYLETFWQNPQYIVTLTDPDESDNDGMCTLLVALMQKNRRSRRNLGMDCLTIGFAIYRITERDMMEKPIRMNFFKYNASVARSPAFINLREVCETLGNFLELFSSRFNDSILIFFVYRSAAVSNCLQVIILLFHRHSNRTKKGNSSFASSPNRRMLCNATIILTKP